MFDDTEDWYKIEEKMTCALWLCDFMLEIKMAELN